MRGWFFKVVNFSCINNPVEFKIRNIRVVLFKHKILDIVCDITFVYFYLLLTFYHLLYTHISRIPKKPKGHPMVSHFRYTKII